METIVLFHNSKWYAPVWALLFALSLILLWYHKRIWKQGFDAFFWVVVISIGVLYCPLLANILIPRFFPSFAEYERLAWIFFEIPLISYVVIMITKGISSRKDQYFFILAFLAVLILFGSPDNRMYYKKPQNVYKISQDALTVCNSLSRLSPEGEVILCIQFDSYNTFLSGTGLDGELYYGIRTYESRYHLEKIISPPEKYEQEGYYLADKLPEEIDYYICPKSKNVYSELERLGYTYVTESENFAIFQNNNKKEAVSNS